MNSYLVYVNALWHVDCCGCYLGHCFSTTKDKALQDSWRVNNYLVCINALWAVDCRRCYLDHCFSCHKRRSFIGFSNGWTITLFTPNYEVNMIFLVLGTFLCIFRPIGVMKVISSTSSTWKIWEWIIISTKITNTHNHTGDKSLIINC